MLGTARKTSLVGLACVACYLIPQLLLIAQTFVFPTVHGGEWFWAFALTFPWFRLTTVVFENTYAQLASSVLLSTATYYLIGLLLERLYFNKRIDKSPT